MSMRFGNYDLLSLVGRGGMAEVFRAKAVRGPLQGREICLKRLLPSLINDPVYLDLFLGVLDAKPQK